MSRKWIPMYLVAAALAFTFGACGGGGVEPPEDTCVECPPGAGAAVWCHYGLSSIGICGASADLAAFQCIEGGGSWELAEVCLGEPVGTETWGGDEPWDPSRDVTLDESTGDFVIDQVALDELKRDPGLLFSDTTTLEPLEGAYFTLTAPGQLSEALGWEPGDLLLSVNNYTLDSAEAFADAYPDLTQSQKFELTLERDGRAVVLRYRVE